MNKLNVARMQSPWLDAACIGLKLAVAGAVVAYVLAGCGGAAFSTLDAPDAADTGAGDASAPDSGDAQDARGGEQSLADAVGGDSQSTSEGGDAHGGDAAEAGSIDGGPACCSNPTAACSYPLASCPIASENHGSWPSYFEVYMAIGESCTTIQTTAECLCNYNCDCIVPTYQCPAGGVQCTSNPIQGVLITCDQ